MPYYCPINYQVLLHPFDDIDLIRGHALEIVIVSTNSMYYKSLPTEATGWLEILEDAP